MTEFTPQSSNISALGLIEAGLTLSCALVWSDTIKKAVETIYPTDKNKELQVQIIYAIILTIIVILLFYILNTTKTEIKKVAQNIDTKNIIGKIPISIINSI